MIPGMIPVEFSHALLITGSRSWVDEHAMRAAFNDLWLALGLFLYVLMGSDGFDNFNGTRSETSLVLVLLLTLVTAPLGEEALFRGVIYPLLRQRVGVLASITVTALSFAVVHSNVVQFASALPLAVLLAVVYERTRSLWPCVVIHLGVNLAATLVPAAVVVPLVNPISAFLLTVGSLYASWMLAREQLLTR